MWHADWAEKHANATWEINWPKPNHSPWPEELVGIMDFESDWIFNLDPGCEIQLKEK